MSAFNKQVASAGADVMYLEMLEAQRIAHQNTIAIRKEALASPDDVGLSIAHERAASHFRALVVAAARYFQEAISASLAAPSAPAAPAAASDISGDDDSIAAMNEKKRPRHAAVAGAKAGGAMKKQKKARDKVVEARNETKDGGTSDGEKVAVSPMSVSTPSFFVS